MNLGALEYAAPGPYPKIGSLEENFAYARDMLSNMAGQVSEMSAISLYIYDHLYEYPFAKDLTIIFKKIAMVEMHHLNIFGELARELGEDPRLWSYQYGRKQYWSPRFNQYPTDFPLIVQYAMETELEAIEKYQQQANTIKDSTVVDCLLRIIEDEKVHVQIFNTILDEYFQTIL